jgi:hypothetical protein
VPSKQPIILTDEIVPPPALIRAGLDDAAVYYPRPGRTRQPPLHRVFHRQHS